MQGFYSQSNRKPLMSIYFIFMNVNTLYFSDQILLVFLVNTILLKSKSMIFYSEPLLFTVTTFTKVFIWE